MMLRASMRSHIDENSDWSTEMTFCALHTLQ